MTGRRSVSRLILLGIGAWIRLVFIQACKLAGIAVFCLSMVLSVSIFSSDWREAKIKSAEFGAQEAKALASQSQDMVMLKMKDAEILRHQLELQRLKAGMVKKK